MKKHGDAKINIKVDIKVKQLMTSETQKLKTDVDFQIESNIRISSDVCKEKFQSYSEKLKFPKIKRPKSNCLKEELKLKTSLNNSKEGFMKDLFMYVKSAIDACSAFSEKY